MPGPRQRHRLRSLARRLALRRPRVHPPRPVLVVAVADDERERRAERAAVPQAGEHLDLVRLDLLARAAAVALLAPAQVGVDRRPVEHEPAGQPGQDRDERRAVRLAGGVRDSASRAQSVLRRASRQAGPACPVQTLERRRAPAGRAPRARRRLRSRRHGRRACAVSPPSARYGKVDRRVCPALGSKRSSSFTGVAWTTSSASLDVRRPVALPGEHMHPARAPRARRSTHAAAPPGSDDRRSCRAVAPRAPRCPCWSRATRPSRITSVLTDSTPPSTSSQSSATARLCGVVTLAPRKPRATSPRTASSSCSGGTPSGTYATSSPRAANAAFCIGGESEPHLGVTQEHPRGPSCRRSPLSRQP